MPNPAEQLANILRETAGLMEEDGNQHWADWLYRDAEKLKSGDIEGAANFLRAFGGMGSLNDVYGSPGKNKPEEEKCLVEKICDRIDIAWHLASKIARETRK